MPNYRNLWPRTLFFAQADFVSAGVSGQVDVTFQPNGVNALTVPAFDLLKIRGYPLVVTTDGVTPAPSTGGGAHPDLATHDTLGLATQGELDAVGAASLLKANNLSDLASSSTARGNLGLVIGTDVPPVSQLINAQVGTAYSLVLADAGKLVTLDNAAAINLTLPSDATAAYPIGAYTDLLALGAGQVTAVQGAGATMHVSGLTAKSRATKSRMGVQKIAANTWSLFGDLAAT